MNAKSTTTGSKQRPTQSKKDQPGITISAEQLGIMTDLLKPMSDFHKAVESATDDDFRLFWDVRLVRGKDTPFKHVRGASTMSGLFTTKMLPRAPFLVEKEVTQKILMPLSAALQQESLRMCEADLTEEEQECDPSSGDEFQDDELEPSADAEL